MKLSACLIVKNEEDNIKNCLDSIYPIVDEIIIVDTGSTDSTASVVSEYKKVKFFHFPWNDNFSDARNESLRHATGDWIIVVDADEQISPKNYEDILRALRNKSADGYYMLTRNYTHNYARVDFVPSDKKVECKDFPGWTPSHKTRLFRNNKGYHFQARMHEVVDKSILDLKGNIEPLDVPIHHYGNQANTPHKIELYTRLATKKLEEEPNNPMALYEMGQLQIAAGQIEEAIKSFERGLEINPNFGDMRYGNLNYELGNIYYQLKNDKETALKYYLKAIQTRPGYMYVYSMVGAIYRKQKKLELAEAYLTEATELGSAIPNTFYDLGFVKLYQEKYEEASNYFIKAIEMAPLYVGAYNNLGICYHLMGKKEEAFQTWNKGLEIDPNHADIKGNMKLFGENTWRAAEKEDEQQYQHHQNPQPLHPSLQLPQE